MNDNNVILGACRVGSTERTADGVLNEIATLIADRLGLDAKDRVYGALSNREKLGSTGLEKGIALPHCSLPDATQFVVGIVSLKEPIDFGAIDGKKSDIFVYVCGPEAQRNDHVRILAALTSQLREEEVRNQIRGAETDDGIARIVRSAMEGIVQEETGPYSLIIVYVQNEDLYEPILEAVSGESDASVSVMETKSAGSILHRMPLFATFWNDQESREIHRIEVVLPRDRVNRTIRKIEELNHQRRGVQISAIDLEYGSGLLDL